MTKPATPAVYSVTISPKTMISNYNNSGPSVLLDIGGTITIGVMSHDSNAQLSPDCQGSLNKSIKEIPGGFAVTWNLDTNNTDAMTTMKVTFTFKKSTTGNVSWNIFSLDYDPPKPTPGVNNKFLPMVYIKTIKKFQNNLNNVADDDFILSGPDLTTAGLIPASTAFGPSGNALSVSTNFFQVFDTLVLQPVYLVQPPPEPMPAPYHFVFRGDRPLGLYKVNGSPYTINPTDESKSADIEKCAENQFINFPELYKFMKKRFTQQASGRGATFPTQINLLDVSITALNQQYADIPTTDLPYQELRSFDKTTYLPQTSKQGYESILETANLNISLPVKASIDSFEDEDGNTIQFTDQSKFAWVHISTTQAKPFVTGQTQSFYAGQLNTCYKIDAEKYYQFIVDVINFKWKTGSEVPGSANIVYLHCNAGKMRTSTFLTCMLLTEFPTISLKMAAYYAKSLFGDDAGNTRAMSQIGDYWGLVQNYCAYLDLKTGNIKPRVASTSEPTGDPFTNSTSPYSKYPYPWQWRENTAS